MSQSYNPLYVDSIKKIFKINSQYTNIGAQMATFDDRYIIKAINTLEDNILVFKQQKFQRQFSLTSPTTNFVLLQNNIIAIYQISKQEIVLINVNSSQKNTIQIQTRFENDKEYQLHYFTETKFLCLVEKNKKQNKAKFFYYAYNVDQNTLQEYKIYETQGEWDGKCDILVSDSCGTYSWVTFNRQSLLIYQMNVRYGLKTVQSLSQLNYLLFQEGQLSIGAIWINKQDIFLCIKAINRDKLQKEANFHPFMTIKKVKDYYDCKVLQTNIPFQDSSLIEECIIIRDFCIFKIQSKQTNSQKSFIYIYSKQQRIFIKQQILSSERIWPDNKTNSFIQFRLKQNDSHLQIIKKNVIRKISSAFQSIFNVLQKTSSLSSNYQNAILIFGTEKSGKTTLRHYLAGHQLIHQYNDELGYSQIINTSKEEQLMNHDNQSQVVWLSEAKDTLIFDIPDCNDQSSYLYAGICLLLSKIYKWCKNIQFVVTIPYQFMEDSSQNEQTLSFIAELIKKQKIENISSYMTIVLTKIQNSQSSLQIFTEYIEQIGSINQQVGFIAKSIADGQRLLIFQNRQITQGQGSQLLKTILSFEKLSFSKQYTIQIEKFLLQHQAYSIIISEARYQIQMMNEYLRFFSSKIVNVEFTNTQYFYDRFIIIKHQEMSISQDIFEDRQISALILIKIILKLKQIGKISNDKLLLESLNQLKDLFVNLSKGLIQHIRVKFQNYRLTNFIFLMKKSIELMNKVNYLQIFQNPQKGFLNASLNTLFEKLKTIPSVEKSTQKDQLNKWLGLNLQKKKKIIKVQVAMEYAEEKLFVLKKKQDISSIISKLPHNALKLDLMMDQIKKLMKKTTLEAKDYILLKYYIRDSSRICQYHQLYIESLTFSLIIPDFISIEQTIEEFVKDAKMKNGFQSKKLFSNDQKSVIDELMTISRDCLRDRIVKKLINLYTLYEETLGKSAKLISQSRKKKEKENLSTEEKLNGYKQKLENRSIKYFYNLQNQIFTKMMEDQNKIIQACLSYENDVNSKQKYEKYQIISHILDRLPINK